jgi:hypothetical protein
MAHISAVQIPQCPGNLKRYESLLSKNIPVPTKASVFEPLRWYRWQLVPEASRPPHPGVLEQLYETAIHQNPSNPSAHHCVPLAQMSDPPSGGRTPYENASSTPSYSRGQTAIR